MSIDEYLRVMTELGYPRPSICVWLGDEGELHGSASYMGTCGHGGNVGFQAHRVDELVEHLFGHVSDSGKRYEEAHKS
jgi:hypothetical protein